VITGSPRLSTAWLIAKVTKRENPSAASAHGSKPYEPTTYPT
jgi:hypothetical protein